MNDSLNSTYCWIIRRYSCPNGSPFAVCSTLQAMEWLIPTFEMSNAYGVCCIGSKRDPRIHTFPVWVCQPCRLWWKTRSGLQTEKHLILNIYRLQGMEFHKFSVYIFLEFLCFFVHYFSTNLEFLKMVPYTFFKFIGLFSCNLETNSDINYDVSISITNSTILLKVIYYYNVKHGYFWYLNIINTR